MNLNFYKYFIGILLISLSGFVQAQNTPLNISIVVLPPYSMEAMDYFSSPTQTTLTILNPTNQPLSVYLAGSLRNLSTNQSVTIPNNVTPAVPPLIVEPGVRIMTGADLQQYVDESTVQFSGISQEQVISGNLPEGEYQLCLQAYDYQTHELRSQNEPLGCSNVFTIQFVQPPILISPQCSTEVTSTTPQNIIFSWFPPAVSINPGLLSYEFKLVELPEGMNPLQVMNSTGVPVLTHTTPSPVFLYSTQSPALIPGRFYAWRVKVTDVSQSIVFSNNGESEICTFRYGMPFLFDTPPVSSLVYPVPGKRIPFIQVPLISRTEPFDSTVTSLSVETELREGNVMFDLIQQTKEYPNGLRAQLQQQLGVFPTIAQLQHAEIGRDLSNGATFGELKPGKTYSVSSNHTFTYGDGHVETSNANGNFLQGFEKPVLQVPARDTTYLNHTVSFQFKTSDFPTFLPTEAGIIPPVDLLNSLIGNDPKLFQAEVKERYRIEVAKTSSFSTILFAATGVFNETLQILKTTTPEIVKDRFYKSVKRDLFLPDTGEYYWRVHWLSNRADSASTPYQTSEVNRFRIAGTLAEDAIQSACMADCDAPLITDRTPVGGLLVNQKVKVGKFEMEIKTIEYLGPAARGTGLIRVPFMNANIKVEFNEALFNGAKQFYQGNVFATHDNSGFLPNIPGVGQLTVTNQEELLAYVSDSRYKSVLDPSVPMGLPLGLDKEIEGERYMVAIVGMRFDPERASLSAAMSFALPFLPARTSDGETQRIGLGASDICFHPDGLAGAGVGTLYLADPLEADYAPGQYFRLNNTRVTAGVVADSGTYVSWDCQGFRILHLSGKLTFDESVLKPATANGSIALKPVTASFGFNVRRSGNWLAALDFSPFMIPGVDDWTFKVDQATLDFSDLENPENIVYPDNYVGERSVLWNGFHLKSLRVGLPKKFKIRFPDTDVALADSVLKDRVVVAINDLIIDRTGISGKLEALRVLEMENGLLGDWSFAIDTMSLRFVSNSFVSGGFNGRIKTPLSPTLLKYESVLSQGAIATGIVYQFNVRSLDTLTVPIWAAQLQLLPTSRIIVNVDANNFRPELNLNGSVSITTTIGKVPVNFPGLQFQALRLTSAEPYLTCSAFTFASPQKGMAGFPVTIGEIELGVQQDHGFFSWDDTPGSRIALKFTVEVNFTGEANSFSGSTTMAILGRLNPGNLLTAADGEPVVYPSLNLTGIDLKSIYIDGDLGFVSAKGFVSFYAEDPLYGKGFIGGIDATFIKTVNVSVIGSFGEINNMRYWYVDAMAKFVPGIPMGIAPYQIPMDIYGFGGGAFYKMKFMSNPPPASTLANATASELPVPGSTLSNIRLVPDARSNFGLKATVVLGTTGGGTAFNADLTLGATFSNSGGLSQVAFSGSGYFMTSVMDRSFTNVRADVLLQYDFPNKILTGNFGVMVDVPLTLKGTQPKNMAGNAFLYVSKPKWQLKLGEPTPQSAQVGLLIGGVFNAKGYLMTGMDLPAPAPVPSKVTDLLGMVPSQRTSKIGTGQGYAFGASFIPPKINQDYSPFYCNLDAEIGFDMTHFDHGSERCDGMLANEKMGVNGWYSTGTGWGYMRGSLGVVASLFEDNTHYPILDVNAAVLLQQGTPNPKWFKGTLGGNYSILGGLIEGVCRFEVQQGDFCEPPPESPIGGFVLISDVSPNPSQTNVDCGVKPTVVFNIEIDKLISFQETGANGEKRTRRFKFVITEFTLFDRTRNRTVLDVYDDYLLSPDGSQAMHNTSNLLSPFNQYRIIIAVQAREYLPNGEVIPATRNDGSLITERLVYSFETGELPNVLREEYIKFSYPLNRQRYFIDKGGLGIRLNTNVPNLFDKNARQGYELSFYAQFQPVAGGQIIETPVSYTNGTFEVDNRTPRSLGFISIGSPALLAPKTIYRLRIIHRDIRVSGTTATSGNLLVQNAGFQTVSLNKISFNNGAVLLRDRQLEGAPVLRSNEHLIYEYFFRTSEFGTISAKINSLQVDNVEREYVDPRENLILNFKGPEGFERFEIDGFRYLDGFTTNIVRSMDIIDSYSNSWHSSFLMDKIYNTYSAICDAQVYNHLSIYRPTPDDIGLPPNRISGTIRMKGPLTNDEIYPSSNSSSSTSYILANDPYAFADIHTADYVPQQQLILTTSYYAQMDYERMKVIIADMKARFGNNLRGYDPNERETYSNDYHRTGVPLAVRTKVTSFLNTPYQFMYYGPYTISMSGTFKYFNYPQVVTLLFLRTN